jgi:hypothetical protein
MNNIIEKRKKVYKNLPKDNLKISLNDLVLIYNINKNNYKALEDAVKQFLLKSLTAAYNKDFIWTETFLEDNSDLIMNLPNKTPNGIINPKNETAYYFTQVQDKINQILNDLGIYPHIAQMVIPNIRYKNTKEAAEIKQRPYYTGQLHSDAWVGHVGDCQLLIGILGDVDNNTVEFNEPVEVHDNYLDKASSFSEGNTRYEYFKFLGKLSKNTLNIMDHACLHRTLIEINGKPRISIDIAVMINSEYSHANDDNNIETYMYHSPQIIQSIGKGKEYFVKESINSTTTTITII